MPRAQSVYTESLVVYMTRTLKAELTAEAWAEQKSLADYVRGLLSRRGKWARTVGLAGGYEVLGPAHPPKD
jgi:hypothetical protein